MQMSASQAKPCTEEGEEDAIGDGDDEDIEVELNVAQPCASDTLNDVATGKLKWILLGISSHLAWGLYPVFARYLQVTRGLDGLLVLAFSFSFSFVAVQLCTCSGLGGFAGARVGSVYSLLTLGRATTNMLSSKFTLALYTQLITQLGPFVVALLSCAFLQETMPRCFLPALILSTMGAMLTVVGLAESNNVTLGYVDAFGIGLSLVSIIFSAGMRIIMKISSTSLSQHELISWQFTNALPLVAFASISKTSSAWERVLAISTHDVLIVFAFTLVMTLFANVSQVTSVRHLGPTFASSLQPLRLVSTAAGGYLVLGECACSALVWSGLLLITGVLSVYLCAQRQKAQVPADVTRKSTDHGTTVYGRVARP